MPLGSAGADDDLPEGAAFVDLGERACDVGELVGAADRWVELAPLEEGDEGVPLATEVGPVEGPEGSPADADDTGVCEEEPVDLDRRDLPCREADDEQPTLDREAAQAVGEAVATDRVDDDVDAATLRELLAA